MLRNTKPISVELAADIEVNTNFVLPQRGNTILRRVNNYRQNQRESVKSSVLGAPENHYMVPVSNTTTTIGFKNTVVQQKQNSFRAQSINCKNFMLPDSPRLTNYEFTLPYEEVKPQRKTRPVSTNVASDYVKQTKAATTEVSQHRDFQYYDAVKQASKILRKNMVLNFADQIQKTLPIAPQTVQLQPNLVVSQEKINSALRQSVSRTERRLKSTAREQTKGVNSVSPKHAHDDRERDCLSTKVFNKIIPTGKSTLEHAAVLTGRLVGERPKSMRPGHHNFAQIINMQNTGTNSKEFVIAGVLSETKASSDALKSHALKPKSFIPPTTTFSQNTDLNRLTEKNSVEQIKIKVQTPIIQQNFDPTNVKQFSQYQIYWPQIRTSKDDFKMAKFINFLQKGYLQQAATALNSVKTDYPGLIFNKGLLALIQNKPQDALQILEGLDYAKHNYDIAKKQIDYIKVTKDIDPSAVVNQNYFTRTYPYGFKNQSKQIDEKSQKPVLNEWDYFLLQIKKYKKEDFQRFVEDKKLFDKIIARANHICDEESKLIPNVITRIMKDPNVENSETDKIINVTLQRDTVLRDAPNLVADKALEEVFIEMINMQSTYCVGVKDPINESYDMLVEGLRAFDEKFSLEQFANQYLATCKNGVAEIQALLKSYDVQDKLIMRARTFIISCFDVENTPDQNDYSLNCLLRIVRDSKEAKLKRTIDPERFQIEAIFTHLVDDIITASRNQKGPGTLDSDDQYWIDRLNFHKELSGRSDQVVVMKVAEISKQHQEELQTLERDINRPEYYDKLEANKIPRNLKVEIYKKLEESWQRHIKKPLSEEEKNKVKQEVQDMMLEIEQVAKKNIEIIKENQEFHLKMESDVARGVYVSAKRQKRINVNQSFKESLRKKIHQKIQEEIDKRKEIDSDYQISEDDNFDDDLEDDKKKAQQFVFHEGHMKVTSDQVQTGTSMLNLWADSSGAVNLRKALHNIQLMCEDENIIFNKDAIRLAPLLEKWGIEAEKNKEAFDKELQKSEEVQIKKERPKIGQEITEKMLQYLQKSFEDIKELFQSQLNKLDEVLVENFRFFSIIDRNVRLAIYQSVELVHFQQKGTLIESDVDETDYVYVVIQGYVDYMLFKFDTKVTVVAATYRAGEVFGDASIQRQYFDVFKCLSKDRKYLETSCDNVYALRIPKRHFVDSIFAQMRVELMYKITMFRNTDYFKELSPYSLVMFASICDVMDYKFGEIIVEQGEKPNACYLIAHGQCQSFYHYVEQQSTNVSKYARKVLQNNNSKPFIQSKLDYKNLPSQYIQKTRTSSAAQKSRRTKNSTLQNAQKKQDDIQLDAPQMKRAFYHGIISENLANKTVQYENHVVFGDIRQGNVFGARTLLDHPTFNKHVSQNSLRFAEQLGLVAEDWIDNLKEKRQEELNKKTKSQTDVLLKAYQQQQKFCKECFEQRKPVCECGLKDLNDEQKRKFAELSKTEAFTIPIEEQPVVINDPDDLSKSISVASNEIRSTSQLTDFKLQGKDTQGESTGDLKIKQRKTSNFSKTTRRQHTKESDELTEEACQRMFIDYMHDNLIRSQTSIMVTSATAKLIVIRKEDKTFLNEALKQSIDKVIIEQNFKDHDRPFPNFKLVQKSIEEARGWICHKKKTEEAILKEAKLDRASNKLLV